MRYSIIVICCAICLCSCKTKEVVKTKTDSDVSYLNKTATIDTSRVLYIDKTKTDIVINETIIETEYDKDTGVIAKKTEKKREIRQGIQADITQEEQRAVVEESTDSLDYVVQDKVETSTNRDGLNFGKYFGITLGCVIGLLLIYLMRKFRVS